MPVGTLNSSIYRRHSGHATWMEIDINKPAPCYIGQSTCDSSIDSACTTHHADQKRTTIVQKKAGIDCDAAVQTAGDARQAHGRPLGQFSITLHESSG